MPLPIQNDFLRPFLEQLASGDILTRAQLRAGLIKTFKLTSDQIEEKSGPHNVLTNRLAWCDSHFGAAGFVQKQQHPTDRMQDTFRITSLGLREVRTRYTGTDPLTVGYLQGFARSNIHRGAGSDETTSEAERELYEALEALRLNTPSSTASAGSQRKKAAWARLISSSLTRKRVSSCWRSKAV